MIRGMLAFIGIKDLVTICNAFAGFAAIVVAAKGGNLPLACGLIFLAAVFDFLDGALARATAPNPFGKELDSLCDAVSFGLAPAALVFFQGPTAPLYYLAAPLIYLAGAIFRLARFNVTTQKNFYLNSIIRGIESGRFDGLGIQINGSDLSSFEGEMNGNYTSTSPYLQNTPCDLWKMIHHQM